MAEQNNDQQKFNINSVPKLMRFSGDPADFYDWRPRCENWMDMTSKLIPGDVIALMIKGQLQFGQTNGIVNRIPKQELMVPELVDGSAMGFDGKIPKGVYRLFEVLKEHGYQDSGYENERRAFRRFQLLRRRENRSTQEYTAEYRRRLEEYQQAGFQIDETTKIQHFVIALATTRKLEQDIINSAKTRARTRGETETVNHYIFTVLNTYTKIANQTVDVDEDEDDVNLYSDEVETKKRKRRDVDSEEVNWNRQQQQKREWRKPQDLSCYKCREPGHLARDCQKGFRCFNCNEFGHMGKDCPLPDRRIKRNKTRETVKHTKHQEDNDDGDGDETPSRKPRGQEVYWTRKYSEKKEVTPETETFQSTDM
jgi:hypothetical protein